MVCGAISGNRPLTFRSPRPIRSTVEDVRLGLHPTGRQSQGGRQRDPHAPGAQRTGESPLDLQRPGVHRGADLGGKVFAIVTVVPALVITAWLLAGLPLLLADRFFPVPMVLITVPAAAGLVLMAGRQVPGRWPGPGAREQAESVDETGGGSVSWSAWWGLAGTLLVAAGFGAWQLWANSPQLIVDRAPGAFFQYGYWIAEHGSLPIPPQLAAFGGSHPGLTFSSFGFVSHAGAVVPQMAAGLPITLAAGLWTHGLAGGVAMSPLLGALAVLSVGGLTGRLAGPKWAPVGAFLLALTLPETLHEPIGIQRDFGAGSIVRRSVLGGGLAGPAAVPHPGGPGRARPGADRAGGDRLAGGPAAHHRLPGRAAGRAQAAGAAVRRACWRALATGWPADSCSPRR